MHVLIAGGHGKIALELTDLLHERGDQVRSLIRNVDHASDVKNAGGAAVVLDLEATTDEELDLVLTDIDAIVFAAGAGPGSSAERKDTVDHQGATLLIEAAKRIGVKRYVIVSSTGANPDHQGDEVFDAYLRAKGRADRDLAESGLDYTIVKPVHLNNGKGNRHVSVGERAEQPEIPREDVAGVLAEVLRVDSTIGKAFEVSRGDVSIKEAVASL
ncbi:MAG TPA: SDR family oxidoreductase [Solirubrobacterales bacterium]|nr:SDR family oxidoreductase [Solirubrobacterales bacterium]